MIRRPFLWLSIVLVVLAAGSLLAGPVWLDPFTFKQSMLDPRANLAQLVLLDIRMPRMVLAILVGGILGLSGAVLQGLLRNPLVDPGLLGVSAGASLGAVIAIYYGLTGMFGLGAPILALIGAMATASLALLLARGGGTLALILAGAAISSLAGAGVSLALNLAPNPYAAYEIMAWLMGSLNDRSWNHVLLAAPFILVGGALLFTTTRALDALTLGEAQAESLGINVRAAQIMALIGTALGVGAATAVTGAIGFVGLMAPHVVRPLVGYRPAATLAPSALVGAVIVLLADIATRVVQTGAEIRLGVFVALIGSPFFLWVVLHVRNRTA